MGPRNVAFESVQSMNFNVIPTIANIQNKPVAFVVSIVITYLTVRKFPPPRATQWAGRGQGGLAYTGAIMYGYSAVINKIIYNDNDVFLW